MSAQDSSAMPVKGQAFRWYWRISSSVTGNPLTGGLTGLAGTVSIDGGSFSASGNVPVEIGASGYGYIDLLAAEMNGFGVVVQIAATNASSIDAAVTLAPAVMDEATGRADAQQIIRWEQYFIQVWMRWFNRRTQSNSTGAYVAYKKDSQSLAVSGSVDASDTDIVDVGKLS